MVMEIPDTIDRLIEDLEKHLMRETIVDAGTSWCSSAALRSTSGATRT